jgi:SulP family sulfate permease
MIFHPKSVVVAATVTKFGLDGLLLTVFISGFMLTLIGLLRLGSLIRYTPHAVTVGC